MPSRLVFEWPFRRASKTFSATPNLWFMRSPMIPVSRRKLSLENLVDSSVAFDGIRNVKLFLGFQSCCPRGFLFRGHFNRLNLAKTTKPFLNLLGCLGAFFVRRLRI